MENNSNSDLITCKPTSWFFIRAIFAFIMFSAFSAYFYYDGAVGYRNKNVNYYEYSAKSQVKEFFQKANRLKGNFTSDASREINPAKSETSWKVFTATNTVQVFKKRDLHSPESLITDTEECFPKGYDFPKKFPTIYADAFQQLTDDPNYAETLWANYAAENNLNQSVSEYFKPLSDIKGQFNWAIGSLVLAIIVLFFLIRTSLRSMSVSADAYSAPNGRNVPFASVYKIDKRKWSNKGVATLYYKTEMGAEEKVKIDGMIYGQFDEKNANNAEALYQHIESHVGNVEIIDYQEESQESS